MSERKRRQMKEQAPSIVETESEPHPADLLANLLRAEAEAGLRPTPASDTNLAAHPAPSAYPGPVEPRRLEAVPPAARALAAPANAVQDASSMQKTLQSLQAVLPLLPKLLPLLDGNILGAIMAMVAPGPQAHPAQKPVDLSPVEGGLADLKTQQQELRGQIQAQDSVMKKMAEQLENVREATDRNTREQEDLIDELKANSRKTNIVAFLAFVLLSASIAMNVVLYLEIHRLLP
jgi:hypothetical protein